MKLSARNQLKGKIIEVKKGATTAHVRIDVGGQIITASITNESADELKLEKGKTAYAIIKSDERDGGRGLVGPSNVRTCRNGGFIASQAEKTKTIR